MPHVYHPCLLLCFHWYMSIQTARNICKTNGILYYILRLALFYYYYFFKASGSIFIKKKIKLSTVWVEDLYLLDIITDTLPVTYRREPIPTSTNASSNFIRDAEERSKLRETDSLSIDWETNGWID